MAGDGPWAGAGVGGSGPFANRAKPLYNGNGWQEMEINPMKIALCAHCGKRFKARSNKRFCSDRCRYESHRITIEPCIYCGCPADSIDHVPPQSVRMVLAELNLFDRFEFVEVPACRECNCALGAKSLFTIKERKAYMKDWIAHRYRKYLALPEWTETQKAQLGEGLHSFVMAGEIIAELARKRLRW